MAGPFRDVRGLGVRRRRGLLGLALLVAVHGGGLRRNGAPNRAPSARAPPARTAVACDRYAATGGSNRPRVLARGHFGRRALVDALQPGQTGCFSRRHLHLLRDELVTTPASPSPPTDRGSDPQGGDQGEAGRSGSTIEGMTLDGAAAAANRPQDLRRRRGVARQRDHQRAHLHLRPHRPLLLEPGATRGGDRAQPHPRLRRAAVDEQGPRHLRLRGPGHRDPRQLDLRQRRPRHPALPRRRRLEDHRQRDRLATARGSSSPARAASLQRQPRRGQRHRQLEAPLERLLRTPGPDRTGNLVRNNCVWAGERCPDYESNGGVETESEDFSANANTVVDPHYADPAADDYTLSPKSQCPLAKQLYRPKVKILLITILPLLRTRNNATMTLSLSLDLGHTQNDM